MAIGAITEIINASELNLNFGGDIYIMLTNLQIHVGRTEDRVATTDAGALYTYGKGENFFTATLVLTTAEIIDTNAAGFNKLSQIDGDGNMPTRDWLITGTAIGPSGVPSSVEWACTGVLKEYDIKKNPEGKVEIDIFVRITADEVTVT